MRADVEGRRVLMGHAAEFPDELSIPFPSYRLAVTYRCPHLLTALADGQNILEISQHRVSSRRAKKIRELIRRDAELYDVREIVVESRAGILEHMRSSGLPFRTISWRQAKQEVIGHPGQAPPPDGAFFSMLVTQHPELRRYVRILSGTGRVAITEKWRTTRLIVAALALAASADS